MDRHAVDGRGAEFTVVALDAHYPHGPPFTPQQRDRPATRKDQSCHAQTRRISIYVLWLARKAQVQESQQVASACGSDAWTVETCTAAVQRSARPRQVLHHIE
jgi:hypothetical protein